MKQIVLIVLSVIVVVLTFAAIGGGNISLEVDESRIEQREEEVKLIETYEGELPEGTTKEDFKNEGSVNNCEYLGTEYLEELRRDRPDYKLDRYEEEYYKDCENREYKE